MAKMLTTIDNPYNPFTEFDAWYKYDMVKGYSTCGLLDRICKTSEKWSDTDIEKAKNNAIDYIVSSTFLNPSGLWIAVEQDVPVKVLKESYYSED